MKKKLLIGGGILLLVFIIYVFMKGEDGGQHDLYATVEKGPFSVIITTTGELEAKNSVKISGPSTLRSIGEYNVKIVDMVPEGTMVEKGAYVASLDKSGLADKIKNQAIEMDKIMTELTKTKLDTALDLRLLRNDLINYQYDVKEKEISVEQSKFEPPAIQRQAEMDLEKAHRTLDQAKRNYDLKIKQAQAKVQSVMASIQQIQSRIDLYNDADQQFRILAPEKGMITYQREWNGQKKGVGSMVSAWDPVVATLPDLSKMLSRTYVNEVEIRKVEEGQQVTITLDAFPEKKLTGKVISVANMGEQMPNSDAKVFEVQVEINEQDSTLRPGMTTGNQILAKQLDKVCFAPLECIFNSEDTLTYVVRKNGRSLEKQEVKLGATNENYVVIENGVKEGDVLMLSSPSEQNMDVIRLKDEGGKK
ncbi:MAG: HlyD family efflux transporter periplasmic adaptor subunit [Flavobacteriales bacterium]|nr:HlyD family efflux transporter periplasmic adaptor subunit [Flavobacteriales bacterium]MCB9448057.1 HlyD family efflux transporter periplasmic adaptor subunit [Flavobacteriales bacterium]